MTLLSLKEKYDDFFLSREVSQLSEENVPVLLRPYIPYAAFWGIADDIDRESLVQRAPKEVLDDLRATITVIDPLLNEWLGGEEADKDPPSEEYIAFSAMRLAAW